MIAERNPKLIELAHHFGQSVSLQSLRGLVLSKLVDQLRNRQLSRELFRRTFPIVDDRRYPAQVPELVLEVLEPPNSRIGDVVHVDAAGAVQFPLLDAGTQRQGLFF